jgi:hypothetical protein
VFAKLVVLVIFMGVCACGLLAARQMRMQAAHELTEAHLRIMKHDNDLWRIKARIASRVTPAEVERMAGHVAPLKPLSSEIPAPMVVGDLGALGALP